MGRLVRGIAFATLASLLLLIAWGLPRGLDITDESLNLLLYEHAGEYRSNFSMHHLIVSRATGWMHPTILAYRWLALALTVLAAVVFAYGFWHWLRRWVGMERNGVVDLTLVLPIVLIGSLSAYGLGDRTLSYNNISSALLFSASGLLLYALSNAPPHAHRPGRVALPLFIVGALSAIDLFVKFPTAILMFGAAVGLIALYMGRGGRRDVATAIGVLALGASAGLLAYFGGVQSMSEWLANYRAELRVASEGSHYVPAVLRGYARNGDDLLRVLLRHFGVVFVACFVAARGYALGWHRESLRKRYLLLGVGAATLLYAAHRASALDLFDIPYFNHYRTFYVYVLILCAEVTVLVAGHRAKPHAPRRSTVAPSPLLVLPGVVFLLALPFAGAIGTRNNIFLNATLGIAGWFALAIVLGVLIEQRMGSRLALFLAIVALACFAGAQITGGMLWKPYLLAAPLRDQTVALDQPASVRGLKVDQATAGFAAQLRSMLRQGSFQQQDYMLVFYNAPGLVYLMGGRSPGAPAYFREEHARTCRALETSDLRNRAVFVLVTRKVEPRTGLCLKRAGVSFPDEFVQLGRVYNPYSASPYGWRAQETWITLFRQSGGRRLVAHPADPAR